MTEPKISVILPCYNAHAFMAKTLDSLREQTWRNLEIIIINDGSTDNSIKIIKKFKEKDQRIKLINQKNFGLTKTLNNSLLKITSKYVARMDADDISHPERLEKQLEEFLKNGYNRIK